MVTSGRFYFALVVGLIFTLCESSFAATIQTEQTKLSASDGEIADRFGHAVGVSGAIGVIGAPWDDDNGEDSGAAYIFQRSANRWTELGKLVALDGAPGDQFGSNLAISGDTLIIGAPYADEPGQDGGAAYIFVRAGRLWLELAKLLAGDGAANDFFGFDVAIDGDSAIIGAPGLPGGQDMGAAYIFVRDGDDWSQRAKLLSGAGMVDDRFGQDVSISGHTAIVGANSWKGNPDAISAAYIFGLEGRAWELQEKLLPGDGVTDSHFGCDVSIHGDTALVGALFDNENGLYSGAAYIYERTGELWTHETKLVATDGAALDRFGWAVSVTGDTALIGAPYTDDTAPFGGAAYVFKRVGDYWVEKVKLLASDGDMNHNLGYAVSSAGDTIMVGAPRDGDNGQDSGAVYAYSPIFADGFESGDPLSWSGWVPHCSGNGDCGEGEFCKKNGCDNLIGFCKPTTGFFCLATWDPVCGCDGVTYSNACYAEQAGVNIASNGECPP